MPLCLALLLPGRAGEEPPLGGTRQWSLSAFTGIPDSLPSAAWGLGAPESVRAAPGNGLAEVRWSAVPGSTGFRLTVLPGGAVMNLAGSATSARVTGRPNGTSYSFTVQSDRPIMLTGGSGYFSL